MKFTLATAALFAAVTAVQADTYGGKYQDPANLPAKVDSTQTGYNDCIQRYGSSSQTANCNNLYINSIKDFCLYGPRKAGSGTIGDQEETVISWCLKSGYGTRLIPNGAIKGAHFLKTPSYLQVTGTGDLTKINIESGDEGGELDPHGATGHGNPRGALVFTRQLTGSFQRLGEWQHFVSANEFCLRACVPGTYDTKWCPHIYDVMGCYWNEPANYNSGQFEQCDGTEGQWPGVYSGSTWYQGQKPTPPAQKAGKSSNCRQYPTVSQGPAAVLPKRDVQATQVARAVAADFEDM